MGRTEAIVNAALPVLPILVPLGVHFVLVSFVFLSNVAYLSGTYQFTHIVLLLVGLWACYDKKSVIAAVSVIVIVLFTILVDIIQLGLYFPNAQATYGRGDSQTSRTWQFAAGMSIINLLFKPVTVLLTCIAVYVRAGGALPGGLGGGSDTDRGAYDRIRDSNEGGQ